MSYQEGKARAREEAIDYQNSFNEYDYSWAEIEAMSSYFEKVGKRYGLLTEYRNNGII